VGVGDLWTAGLIAGGVALILTLKWRDILAHAFDPVQAQMIGLNVGWLHYGLLAILSATVVAMLSSVGIILAVAFLIAPGAIAFLLTRTFARMLVVSIIAALVAGLSGIYASFWLDSAPAPTIVLLLTAMFLLALARNNIRSTRASAQG
jgi:manganese/iron transport system permease protein